MVSAKESQHRITFGNVRMPGFSSRAGGGQFSVTMR